MDLATFLPVLSLFTLGALIALAAYRLVRICAKQKHGFDNNEDGKFHRGQG